MSVQQLYSKPDHSGVIRHCVVAIGDAPSLEFANAAQWVVHCIENTGPTMTLTPQGSMDQNTWVNLESAITPTAGTVHRGDCAGFPYIRMAVGAGPGKFNFALTHTIASEFTATGGATSAKQDTQITALQLIDNLVGQEYETVAASQTAQALGATGATGDLINGILVIPATTSPGNVLLLDNATSITVFAGGASSVSNLVPFYIPLGIRSVSGAWKITTGADVSCIGVGDFT